MAMSGHDVSILSEDASLSGRISSQDLTILGGFDGEVTVRGRLRVGPNARVKAKVKADVVEIEGQFNGEIRAAALTFAPSAKAQGLFLAERLGIRDGAVVEGSFNLSVESDARPDAKPEPVVAVQTVSTMEGPAETVVTPGPDAKAAARPA
jgi:cytoskeletal protein CcmA (bactofilin family)